MRTETQVNQQYESYLALLAESIIEDKSLSKQHFGSVGALGFTLQKSFVDIRDDIERAKSEYKRRKDASPLMFPEEWIRPPVEAETE